MYIHAYKCSTYVLEYVSFSYIKMYKFCTNITPQHIYTEPYLMPLL